MSAVPSCRAELRALILEGLNVRYTAESCQDAIETGNHYQSLLLGDERTSGFRTAREGFLDRIAFDGRTVLDLGSNLGELSREARRRNAILVDGYEYDPYFIELANLVNAYNGTTRVSFYQRDITDPDCYVGSYDIVLAFSVFTYVARVLERVADVCDGIFVVETHRLDDNLASYVDPISAFFPHYRLLGESDWGGTFPKDVTRAVLVFAKQAATIEKHLTTGSSGSDP
jgi:SAM-dependent methyltransferase